MSDGAVVAIVLGLALAVVVFIPRCRDFAYRLFFTRDDNLDVLQILYAVLVVILGYATIETLRMVSVAGQLEPSVARVLLAEVFQTFRMVVGALFVTAVPTWLVPSVVRWWDSKHAEQSSKATAFPPLDTSDERGEFADLPDPRA